MPGLLHSLWAILWYVGLVAGLGAFVTGRILSLLRNFNDIWDECARLVARVMRRK
jgi:hypothetical protein